ncbi:hypothetical protein ACWZEH_10155 [Streptomyces sp. QTS137]
MTADKDWWEPYARGAFREIIPFPEAGANGMLAEALDVALSAGVTTPTRDGTKVAGSVLLPASPLPVR